MPPGVGTAPRSSAGGYCCVCCGGGGADTGPRVTDTSTVSRREMCQLISESFLTVKGAALFLPRGNGSSPSPGSRFSQLRNKHAGDIQQHLQTMFTLLRPEDNIKLAVRLESVHSCITRYMVVVSTNGRQDTEESVVLGMDFSPVDSSCSVGLVLPLWSDTLIHLDGDGGFSVSTDSRVHVFKPVSVQAMWSALQSLHKACDVARCHNYFPGSLFLTWVSYYQSRVSSDQARINEWNAMRDVQSHRADSPVLFSDAPTERELTERHIKSSLKEIMMQKDLENVTCKEIRTELEMSMTCNLREFKEFIDNEMIVILGQMDSPTEIFDHVFLGSEWNASNLEELQNSGVQFILNVTREIDNFFPGVFEYHNIRVYDEEATDLLAYWNDTYKFISRAKKAGSKCLVHCKMGISRSAATVIAYAMKELGWELRTAFDYVKERRQVTKPNPSFMRQLEEYQGILLASKQRHNKLWRSHSDSDLSDQHHEPLLSKSLAQPHSLGRSDPHNQAGGAGASGPSVKELLESLGSSVSAGHRPSGGASRSASRSDAGVQLGSASCDGVAALTRFRAPPPAVDPAPSAAADSSPPLSNGVCDSEEPHSSPRLAPEPQKTEAPSVSVAPSPLRPTLSPAPAPATGPAGADEVVKPQVAASCAQHIAKPTPVPVPAPAAAQASGVSPSASAPVPTVRNPESCGQQACGQQTCGQQACGQQACDGPAARPLSAGDWIGGDHEAPLGHSADHINFFSAREKFKGMSRDGRSQVKGGAKEPQEDEDKTKEVPVPVQTSGPGPATSQSQPPVPQAQETQGEPENGAESPQKQEEEEEEEAEEEEEEEEESARLYSDWTRGSVRRVTRQLEQRMKHDTSSSPPPPSCSQWRAPAAPLATSCPVSTAQEERGAGEEEGEGERGRFRPVRRASGGGGGAAPQNHRSTKGHRLPGADGRLPSTSYPSHHAASSPFASVNFLCLEGVTQLESCSDWDWDGAAHGDVVMRETWETLCELGAFLQQVGADPKPNGGGGGGGGGSLQKKVREVEARIRQAGLTPPSLMKRSASLAKLGCLEVLANELSEWELGCSAPSEQQQQQQQPVQQQPPPPLHAAADESKKQRVQSSAPSSPSSPSSSSSPSPSSTSSSSSSARQQAAVEAEPVSDGAEAAGGGGGGGADALMAARQQYGRTHPLRRLKKRTIISTLYHTM